MGTAVVIVNCDLGLNLREKTSWLEERENEMKSLLIGFSAVVVATLGFVGPASAGVVELGFTEHYADGVAPAGDAPWITLRFTDVGVNEVRMDILNLLVGDHERIHQINFNLNPLLNGGDASDLLFTQVINANPNNITADSSDAIANAFSAGPALGFDTEIIWTPPAAALETSFLLSGISGLTAESFLFKNTGSTGPHFYAAAHIGGVGPDGEDSAWLGATLIPLPQAWLLLVVGLMVVPALRYRFRMMG